MSRKLTRQIVSVRLSEGRIKEINDLVASWSYETKAFMLARLSQFQPSYGLFITVIRFLHRFFFPPPSNNFEVLSNPEIITSWQKRFEISGHTNPQQSWNKILEKEVSNRDYIYLQALLERELKDIHAPVELCEFFEKIYRAHIRKEYLADTSIPQAPLLLIVGSSGSGKTSTVRHAIEEVIFSQRIVPEVDLDQKKEEVLAGQPFWKTIEEVDQNLAMEIEKRKSIRFYRKLSQIPLIHSLFKKKIGTALSKLEEQSMLIDYTMVTPNDYQTALAGEPGNYFKKSLGDPKKTSIRHIEEAHSAFGRVSGRQSGVERQQRTLVDTANIVLDEIITGKRDCLLIATTDQPEQFDAAIYRRFVEKGKIINISSYWQNKVNLKEVIRIELARNNIHVMDDTASSSKGKERNILAKELDESVETLFTLFRERTLKLIPSYVRKLIRSLIELKSDFSPLYLKDGVLVRKAFELVARNSYGDLYGKVVDRMDREVKWEEYIGGIKDIFSEMANNCLYYNVSEEKGVVLNGPPGGGKTFLVRTWLSENKDIHDISTSASALQNPDNPFDSVVDNLEKVYDIAKMIAPTVVFFDEGDALAPKRSATGGSPSDKLTNKFLNLIDGEVPLHKVFTVLTTNRLDIIDPALIRSKRLKVLEISGMLRWEDIVGIITATLKGTTFSKNLDIKTIAESAKNICNTPADFTAFVEKARSLRNTEFEVLIRLRNKRTESDDEKLRFVKFNFKTLTGILEAADASMELRAKIRNNPAHFLDYYDEFLTLIEHIQNLEDYPMVPSHLTATREEISQSPIKKGKIQLDEFLEAELSQEPQVGFIIGVGANDLSGMLLPIATSLMYSVAPEKVLVTGAVSSSSSAAAELDMAVQMTQQSAQEALTLIKNYLQSLKPKISIARLLGEFLDKYTIHHQLLSASYNVGGPSAGYALAINTLSSILHIPVYNDFGITGAPWTKGVKKGEVGGSVIIGGHKKKAEKVLMCLRRMYMPLKNYMDLEQEFLENYWVMNKDILGVTHFGDLIPEVLWLDESYERHLMEFLESRIQFKLMKYRGKNPTEGLRDHILSIKEKLKIEMESEIKNRIEALRKYLKNPARDPHLSMEEIYRKKETRVIHTLRSAAQMLKHLKHQ